jgi:hypothetical protein
MKKITIALLATLSMNASAACFFSHERVSGMNKICTYDCVDGQRSITISATSLCPLQLYRVMRGIMGLDDVFLNCAHEDHPAKGGV